MEVDALRNTVGALARSAGNRNFESGARSRLAAKIAEFTDRALLPISGDSACQKGCNSCCELFVWTSISEVHRIAEYLGVPSPEFIAGLETYVEALADHRPERFTRFRSPCPLLVNGECSVYDVRPVQCRARLSLDAAECRAFIEHPEDVVIFSVDGAQEIADTVSKALHEAIVEEPVEFIPALLELLSSGKVSPADERNYVRPWHSRCSGPERSGTEATSADVLNYLDRRRKDPLQDAQANLDPVTTAGAMLRIEVPAMYTSLADEKRWLDHLGASIAHAASLEHFDVWTAYQVVGHMRPLALGYQPGDLKPYMERFGTLLTKKIGEQVAPELCEPMAKRKPGKPRVGFVGSFGDNSPSRWALGWLKAIDANQFDTIVLKTYGPEDAISLSFKQEANTYRRLAGHPLGIARAIKEFDLDYLIYPDLGDTYGILQYAMFRLARKQAAAWGCPFTSGLSTIDHYLSSEQMEPEGADSHYSEKLIRLPGTGLILRAPNYRPPNASRQEFGLPEGKLIAFPQYVIKWPVAGDPLLAEISASCENPILVSGMGTQLEKDIFQARMDAAGVRLQWLPPMKPNRFRQLLRICDSVLDGPGWSGGLTAIYAVQEHASFVNLPGQFLRQRLASGFLKVAGGSDMCCDSIERYVQLATDWGRLDAIKRNMDEQALYDGSQTALALNQHLLASTRA